MRPARFLVALLFGAAVLVTFVKFLLFAFVAVMFIGGIWTVARMMRYMLIGNGHQHHWPMMQYGRPGNWQHHGQNPTPISLGTPKNTDSAAFGRRIEVL
jgi:hypothetical protein